MIRAEILTAEALRDKHGLVSRSQVLAIRKSGSVVVACELQGPRELLCDVLQSSEGPELCLAPGDTVLVCVPEGDDKRGVVLGRIGPSQASATAARETPEEIVIEAKENLTFKCGEGSITLRKDGKILIKGKDLVSRAQRMNRIKGGAVAIN